jgi:hypothetical protein
VLSDRIVSIILAALKQFQSELRMGALVIVDEDRLRVRVRHPPNLVKWLELE